VLTANSRWADETIGGIVLGLQSLPSITWLPMAVLWFGLSERAIIFVVLMGSTFSIAISARAGIRGLPPLLERAAGTLGASRFQRYRYVVLPAMVPSMIQGMKQGWSFAWRSLMAGELLFVVTGLGHLLDVGRTLNDISMVFADRARRGARPRRIFCESHPRGGDGRARARYVRPRAR
jgi:NitT/TauT family transport system permease protein